MIVIFSVVRFSALQRQRNQTGKEGVGVGGCGEGTGGEGRGTRWSTAVHLSRVCSPGAVMAEAAARLLGVKACRFLPRHARALANEFRCYVNYKSGLDRED